MAKQYDVAVIGSGPGGYVAAIRASQLGLKTICLEKNKTLGGTCLNVGCIPSKALLQTTEYYDFILHGSAGHGISVSHVDFDYKKMMERKDSVVKGHTDGVASLFKKNKITHKEGAAVLQSAHLIEVTGDSGKEIIEAENIILATGSEPISLPFLPFDEKIVLSSTGALVLPQAPKTLAVIGAGAIGLELASVYNRLGSKITVIEMLDRVTPGMDHSISRMLLNILKKEGFTFHLSSAVKKGEISQNAVALTVAHDGKEEAIHADAVLVAVGRKPYHKGLGLKELGIQTTDKGFVQVDSLFRTNIPNVYAIGDLIEGPMLAHKASEEGVAAAEIIAGLKPTLNYMAIPNVVYTHPEAASVGLTEQEAAEMGLELQLGTCFFRANPRARCIGYTEGFAKVVGDKKSGRVLGVHILGPQASELIAEGMVAIEKEMTIEELAAAPHAHPTLAEVVKEAALNALGRSINT